jgi:hypothetical protein
VRKVLARTPGRSPEMVLAAIRTIWAQPAADVREQLDEIIEANRRDRARRDRAAP